MPNFDVITFPSGLLKLASAAVVFSQTLQSLQTLRDKRAGFVGDWRLLIADWGTARPAACVAFAVVL